MSSELNNDDIVSLPLPPPQENIHRPTSKLSCKCKQRRCEHCQLCRQCGCTCKEGSNVDHLHASKRSCRKLLLQDNNSLQSINNILNNKPNKKRGRPPKYKTTTNDRSSNESTTNLPSPSNATDTSSKSNTSNLTTTASSSNYCTSTPTEHSIPDIGNRIKSLKRHTTSRSIFHNETSIKLF